VRYAAVALLLLDASCVAIDGYLLPAADPLHAAAAVNNWDRQMDGQTDRWTDTVPTQTLSHTMRAVPIMHLMAMLFHDNNVSPIMSSKNHCNQ